MQVEFLLKGSIIGLLFGIPIGAVGSMTVQRTLNYGIKAGLLTGLGSSVADCLYACIGAFGLNFISDFLINYQTPINLFGGSLLLIMGIGFLCKKKEITLVELEIINNVKTFLSSFVIGITNPTAILTFLFAFSYFGISSKTKLFESIQLVCGVFIGTYLWWSILSIVTNTLREKVSNLDYSKINRVFGIILALFGAVVFTNTIF